MLSLWLRVWRLKLLKRSSHFGDQDVLMLLVSSESMNLNADSQKVQEECLLRSEVLMWFSNVVFQSATG